MSNMIATRLAVIVRPIRRTSCQTTEVWSWGHSASSGHSNSLPDRRSSRMVVTRIQTPTRRAIRGSNMGDCKTLTSPPASTGARET
jgi:hypothetical protein